LRPSVVRVVAASRVDARAPRHAFANVALSPWTLLAIALVAACARDAVTVAVTAFAAPLVFYGLRT
jgi:hypothetical protein